MATQQELENSEKLLAQTVTDPEMPFIEQKEGCDSADLDHLTDSNSSTKNSPEPCGDISDIMKDNASNVPINYPVRGKILARLRGRDFEYYMTKSRIVVGRDSSKGSVDINMGDHNFISRNHLEIVYQHSDKQFYISCGGKNGVFVGDHYQKIGAPRLQLPKSCFLRFPSTQIVIEFQSVECFMDTLTATDLAGKTILPKSADTTTHSLRIQIPSGKPVKPLFFSPCPSPTGTISAINSAPVSPSGPGVEPLTLNTRKTTSASFPPINILPGLIIKDKRIPVAGDLDDMKPPYSYAQLIVQAITSTPDKQMTLSGIYAYISRNYSYYRANEKGWQNSIRHNLSLNRYFVKVARSHEEPGKGCFWRIDPASEPKLVAQAFRRRNKRGVPYFRGAPGALTSQSAPVSPTHAAADGYSRDTSPSRDDQDGMQTIVRLPSRPPTTSIMGTLVPHVITDMRGIQSAPGSPQGYKVLSPASLLTNKVKGSTASVISSKSSGITLLQPFSVATTVQLGSPIKPLLVSAPAGLTNAAMNSALTSVNAVITSATVSTPKTTTMRAVEAQLQSVDGQRPADQKPISSALIGQSLLVGVKRPADSEMDNGDVKRPRQL